MPDAKSDRDIYMMVGQMQADITNLKTDVTDLNAKIGLLTTTIDSLNTKLSEAKGGAAVILWAIGIGGATVGAIVAKTLSKYFP